MAGEGFSVLAAASVARSKCQRVRAAWPSCPESSKYFSASLRYLIPGSNRRSEHNATPDCSRRSPDPSYRAAIY